MLVVSMLLLIEVLQSLALSWFFLPFIVWLNYLFSSFKMCLYSTACSGLRQRWFPSPVLQSLIPIAKESSQEFVCFLGTTVNKAILFKIIDF